MRGSGRGSPEFRSDSARYRPEGAPGEPERAGTPVHGGPRGNPVAAAHWHHDRELDTLTVTFSARSAHLAVTERC